MSTEDHVNIINEDEEKQISEDRNTTAPQAEPDVYTEHDVHLTKTSTDSVPLPSQPLNPPEQIQIHLSHHSNSGHYHHPQSITPEPNQSNHYGHHSNLVRSHHQHSNDHHPDLPPPPAFTSALPMAHPNVSSVPNIDFNHSNDSNPMHNAMHSPNPINHPMVRQLVDMGFPELYVLRACKIFEVKCPLRVSVFLYEFDMNSI